MISEIRIVGFGCRRCDELHDRVMHAVQSLATEVRVVRDNDMLSPTRFGLLALPDLIINGKPICAGRAPAVDELARLLRANLPAPQSAPISQEEVAR